MPATGLQQRRGILPVVDQEPVEQTGPAAEIAAARERFVAALHCGMLERASATYADDARLLAPSAEVLIGPAAIARFWQAGLDAGVEQVDLHCERLEFEPGGRLAYEIGRYEIRLEPIGGRTIVERGRYLVVHRRTADGSWRRAVETLCPGGEPRSEASQSLPGTVRPRPSGGSDRSRIDLHGLRRMSEAPP